LIPTDLLSCWRGHLALRAGAPGLRGNRAVAGDRFRDQDAPRPDDSSGDRAIVAIGLDLHRRALLVSPRTARRLMPKLTTVING
jgi:hypothetical protein